MSQEIENAKAYLLARLAEGDHRPDLHINISAVYQNYLKVVNERPDDYVKEAGDMFAVMRAEQLDRQENLIALYKKLKHQEKEQAYGIFRESILQSSGYGDIYPKLSEAKEKTKAALSLETLRRDTLMELMGVIIAWRNALAEEKASFRSSIISSWKTLQSHDSSISWKKIQTWPPYRNSLYYNDEQLTLLETWFMEAVK